MTGSDRPEKEARRIAAVLEVVQRSGWRVVGQFENWRIACRIPAVPTICLAESKEASVVKALSMCPVPSCEAPHPEQVMIGNAQAASLGDGSLWNAFRCDSCGHVWRLEGPGQKHVLGHWDNSLGRDGWVPNA